MFGQYTTMNGNKMPEISLVTGNLHKVEELRQVIPGLVQVDIDLPEVQAVDSREVIAAKLKIARGHVHSGDIIVEDTALHLECLNGFPGALIKWLLACVDCDGVHELCHRMGNLRAEARTVFGYLADNSEKPLFVDACLHGTISLPRGANGFGWDRIFIPDGKNTTLAEMSVAELQAIKMRRRAAEKLARHLLD